SAGEWMRGEPPGHAAGVLGLDRDELAQQAHHGFGIKTRTKKVLDRFCVCLLLRLAGILRGPESTPELQRLTSEEVGLSSQNEVVEHAHQRAGAELALHLGNPVTFGPVADLVRESRRQRSEERRGGKEG